jgi:hypothetical protein
VDLRVVEVRQHLLILPMERCLHALVSG